MGLWIEMFEHLLTCARASGRLDLGEVLIDGGLVKARAAAEVVNSSDQPGVLPMVVN